MNEGIGGDDYFSSAIFVEKQDNNGEPVKPPGGRLAAKRKKKSEKSRKKREKRQESSVASPGATAAEDGEDEDSTSDLPAIVSSTSGTESLTKAKIKEMKFTKWTDKRSPYFAKIVKSLNATPFVFLKRISRIDWRKLHTIDVDRVIREVDLDALENVLDTITFADIQGEDTRNFSEANFIKVFRLAQLMVEYLLHVQELLASHKETLLATGAELQRRVEKHRHKQAKLASDLSVLRHKFKQAKKTIRTYEIMLRVQNKFQHSQQKLQQTQQKQHLQAQEQQAVGAQTVRCCPLCNKLFESAYYLDLHFARRHPQLNEIPEDKILAAVSKAEEATAAHVRAETSAALQSEVKLLQAMSQAELQRSQAVAQLQISSLEASLRESNAKLLEVQNQLQAQTTRKDISSPKNEKKDDKMQERLKEMDEKLQTIQDDVKHLNQETHNQTVVARSDRGAEDFLAKPGKLKNDRPASAERKRNKERKKWKHNLSSPERSESEGRLVLYNQMNSSRSSVPERKRKQSWQHNVPKTSSSPEKIDSLSTITVAGQELSSPARHRKYKAHQEGGISPEKYRQSPSSGSHTPTSENTSPKPQGRMQIPQVEVFPDFEARVHIPPLEASLARFREVGQETFVMAKAEVEQDLARAGGNRLMNEDGGKVASKIAIFETKVATKKIRREEGEGIRSSVEEVARSQEMKERREAKEKRSIEDAMALQASRKAEIADAATMDVGEEQPSIPPAEKEKWLEEHPYKPIPQRPHVCSKYPHPPDVFSTTREELAHRLDEQLGGELKKFGFARDTAAISDSVYDAAKAVLEKQHKNRVSNLQLNHKKTLEYERGAILWQTQRAVHDRDLQIIEKQFEADSDNSFQQSLSQRSPSPSTDGTEDDSARRAVPFLSPRGQQGGRFGKSKSPVVKSPQSSRSPALSRSPVSPHHKVQEQQQQQGMRKAPHLATIAQGLKSASGDCRGGDKRQLAFDDGTVALRSPPPSHAIRFSGNRLTSPHSFNHYREDADKWKHSPTYLFPTVAKFKQARDNSPPSKDHNGDPFGLGEWDSDDDVPPASTLRETGKHRKADRGKQPKSSKGAPGSNSTDDSEESKIFQELDAEIDEIIRL